MKKLLTIFLLIGCCSFGQSQAEKDSIVNEICKSINKASKKLPDSMKVQKAFEKHLFPYVMVFPEDKRDEIWNSIFFRLQKNCMTFKDIIDKEDPQKGDWKVLDEVPPKKLDDKTCKSILDKANLYYLEHDGDTTLVEIRNGMWIDHFADGSISKLKFRWTTDCEFEIEFIESNNVTRKNFSKVGDIYKYAIIDQRDDYFDVVVLPGANERIVAFKIYFDK